MRTGPTSLAYLKNAFWVDTPDNLFQRLLSETISARTGIVTAVVLAVGAWFALRRRPAPAR